MCMGVNRPVCYQRKIGGCGSVRLWRRWLHRLCPSSSVANNNTPSRWAQMRGFQPHFQPDDSERKIVMCLLFTENHNTKMEIHDITWNPLPQAVAPNVIRTYLHVKFTFKAQSDYRIKSRNSGHTCWDPVWELYTKSDISHALFLFGSYNENSARPD